MARAKATTKATTNKQSVKETKTMAKATTTKKTTTKAKETKEMKNTMTLSAEEMEMIKEMRAGKKATGKAKAEPKTKQEQKAEEKAFDRSLYESIANELGVLGKNGVYKAARPVVYELMELDKIKKSDLTKAKEKLVKIATEGNLTWLLEKLGVEIEEEVEIEDDEIAFN